MIEEHFLGSCCTGPLGSVSYLLGMCEFVCLSKSGYVCVCIWVYMNVYVSVGMCVNLYVSMCG